MTPPLLRPLDLKTGLTAISAVGIFFLHSATFAQETPSVAKPPRWAEKGAIVYRLATPDQDAVAQMEAGFGIVSNLLDKSITQIPIANGLIGHDHPGVQNWDGLWPDWNRVSFRAGGSFKTLSDFMARAREKSNVLMGFHLNITDVNVGLRDYPESREFFDKLAAAKAIYRRDYDHTANKFLEPPFVPQEIDKYIGGDPGNPDPVQIFAIVNYKQFWDSGLAKQMVDEFYGQLPYPPPILYLDVLTATGGNFNPGVPDGPLGFSSDTQGEGILSFIDYLHQKGTDVGTEGERSFLGDGPNGLPRAGYVWLHGKGISADDYRIIFGGTPILARQHVYGNSGAFVVSPIASTDEGLAVVKAHYAALLAGRAGTKKVPGLETLHLADRGNKLKVDEFDIPGTGDRFRGDWADLVNNFYLTMIQELYHIGKKNVRTVHEDAAGTVHVGKYTLSGPGMETLTVADFGKPDWLPAGQPWTMVETPIITMVNVPKAGRYTMSMDFESAGGNSRINIYANRQLAHTILPEDFGAAAGILVKELDLKAGENEITLDFGPVNAAWSDGTVAEWTTPYLGKGFKVSNGDVVFAVDYDRMWPDTWSGQKKIYFFSWDGTNRTWKLPLEWRDQKTVTLYPLTPEGRGKGQKLTIVDGSVAPQLLPQVPYILTESL